MYLPRFVPLSPPYMATWRGKSGKSYEFGVTNRGYSLRDGPAVAVLVEHRPDGSMAPLWVGRNAWEAESGWSFDPPAGQWQDGARGRLALHVRFEAVWTSAQQIEVDDLVAALDPPLNARPAAAEAPAVIGAAAEMALVAVPHPAAIDAVPVMPGVTTGVPANSDAPPQSIPAPVAAETPMTVAAGNAAVRRSLLARLRAAVERLLGGSHRPATTPSRVTSGPPLRPVAPEPAFAATIAPPPVPMVPTAPGEAAEQVAPPPVAATATVVETAPALPPLTPSVRVVASEPTAIAEPAAPREVPIAADRPIAVLFAGEMAHAAGVDILVEAAAVVAADPIEARFLFVGDGPLKAAMMARASAAGYAHRCRFLGHLDSGAFTAVLDDADIVVVPGRVAQDRSVARRALAAGRWLLTTHQACIDGVEHGRNGLVTYDNPGSLVWGLRELMGRIMHHRRTSSDRRAA